ncbi:DUF2330 domain-containing protein [Patulibacter sp. NPDC049589]|uniref:DUF2330 domain-containing protein n=1 Tax=Patulibacter sp. NPDC049589 TaxID=3154731 RepID=UPI003423A772
MPRPLPPRPHPFRPPAVLLVLATAVVLGTLAVARPAGACACGIAYGSRVSTERAIVSLEEGREEIVLGLDLAAPGTTAPGDRRPAVLLPVPSTPRVAALPAGAARVFDELELATRTVPRPRSGDDDGVAAAVPDAGGVSVLSRERIGGYDVTRLRAGDAAALRRWLNAGGYDTPAAAEPMLRDYVRRDWAFVAVRLADPVRGDRQTLSPLRVSFATDRLVYPLRLSSTSTTPVAVDLYVAGDHRVLATGFDTVFAGFVSALRPALSADVRDVVRGRYLTRLRLASDDPKAITSDVHVRRGVSDRLFRSSADYPYETEDNFARGPLPSEIAGAATTDGELEDPPAGALWLVLFPGIALVVLGVFGALRLRERLRRR